MNAKKKYKKGFNKDLAKRFANIHEFCEGDFNKFILFLRNTVYANEYMDSWKRFDETSLPDKKEFCSSLNMEGIPNIDYRHAKRVFNDFNNKNIGGYHDLYVQSDTLLLADVFEKLRNMCHERYELDPIHFLSAPGLAWNACLKKQK